ncbi:MAG: phytoene desaturase family protein [Candidatus Helarchaeota archaeon]
MRIIIIGSGIGGSGIGALIAKETSHTVFLFERDIILGGRCASYEKKDAQGRTWKFDIGCHIFSTCDLGPLGEIARCCGKTIYWSYTKNPGPRVNVMGMELSGLAKSRKKKSVSGSDTKKKKKSKNMTEYLRNLRIEDTWQYDEIPLIQFLDDFYGPKKNAVLKLMYSMNAGVMFGTDPYLTSTGEFLRCMADNYQKMSMGYPLGGTGIIPETYCEVIQEQGGKVFLGKEGRVNKIIVEENEVKGIEAGPDNQFYEADMIIANSDIKTTVFKLVGEQYFPREYVNYVKNLKWGGQVCSVKIGIDTVITDQKMLTYIPKMGEDNALRQMLSDPGNIGKVDFGTLGIPEKTALLIVPISNHDPRLAPKGCQNIHAVTPTAFGGMIKWSKADEKKWERACLNTFATLWPEIEDHIVLEEYISTSHLENRFGKEGAGTGIAQSIDQVGKKRPSMISPIKGLYYCSGDAGGWGIGTELPARAVLELFNIFLKYNFSNNRIFSEKKA